MRYSETHRWGGGEMPTSRTSIAGVICLRCSDGGPIERPMDLHERRIFRPAYLRTSTSRARQAR